MQALVYWKLTKLIILAVAFGPCSYCTVGSPLAFICRNVHVYGIVLVRNTDCNIYIVPTFGVRW